MWDVVAEFRDGETSDDGKDCYGEEEGQHIEPRVERVGVTDGLEIDREEVNHQYHRAADAEGEEGAGCNAALFEDMGWHGGVFWFLL